MSRITFGMASLTGHRPRGQVSAADITHAKQAIRFAVESGITTFHYGPGYESGFILKDLFREGLGQDNLQLIAKLPSPTYEEDSFSAQTIRKFVDQVLLETGFERITVGQYIYQGRGMTEPEKARRFTRDLQLEVADCFEDLRRAGKVLTVAGFAYSREFADILAAMPGLVGIAGFFNMMEPSLYEVLPALRARQRYLIAMRPFCGGVLTDKRRDWNSLPANDRLKIEQMRLPFLQREELGRLFTDNALPFEARALKYILSFPEVTTCIVGFDNQEQVQRVLELVKAEVPFDNKADKVQAIFRKQSAECRQAAFHSTKGWLE